MGTKNKRKYAGTLREFCAWQLKRFGEEEEEEGREREEARGIAEFIRSLVEISSGETLATKAHCLETAFKDILTVETKAQPEEEVPLLRRAANKAHPPAEKTAEPVSPKMRQKLMQRAPYAGLSGRERQALDMFCVAFAAMSRISEIAGLRARDVDGRKGIIIVRPKTAARTWKRVTKKVYNGAGLEARRIIERYEESKERARRPVIQRDLGGRLNSRENRRPPQGSGEEDGPRYKINDPCSSQGGCSGECDGWGSFALGPSLGAWEGIDSLQDYVGSAIRSGVSPLERLEWREREMSRRGRRGDEDSWRV